MIAIIAKPTSACIVNILVGLDEITTWAPSLATSNWSATFVILAIAGMTMAGNECCGSAPTGALLIDSMSWSR